MLIFTLTSILIAALPCTSNPLNILHKNKLDFKDKFQIHQTLAKRSTILKDSEKLNIRLKRDYSNLVKNLRNTLQKPLENIDGISERMFDSNGPSISKISAEDDINKLTERSKFSSFDDNLVNERMLVPLDGSKTSALNNDSPSVSSQSKANNFNLNNGNSKANAMNGGTAVGVLQNTDNAGSNVATTSTGSNTDNANNMASLTNSGNGVSTNLNNDKPNKDKIALSAVTGNSSSISKEQGLSINANEKKGKNEGVSISSGSGSGTSLVNSNKGKVGISNDNLSNSNSTGDSNSLKGSGSDTVVLNNGKGGGSSSVLDSGKGAGLGLNNLGLNVNKSEKGVSINSKSDNLSNLGKTDKNAKIDLNNKKNSNSNLGGSSVNTDKGFAGISSDTNQVNNSNKGKGAVVPKENISSNINNGSKNISQEKGKQELNDGNDDTKGKANGSLSDEPSTAVSVSSNGGSGVTSVSSSSPGAALPLLDPVSTKPLNNLIENIGNNIKNNLFGGVGNGVGNGNTAVSIANNNGGTAAVKNDSTGFALNVNNEKSKPEELGKSPEPGNGALAVSSSSPSEKETEIEKPKKETDIPDKGVGNGALAVSSGNAEPSKGQNEEKLPNTPNIPNDDKSKVYTSQDKNIVVKIGKNNFVTSITFKDPSALNQAANEIPKQGPNLPVTTSSFSVNDGNKDTSNDNSKNIPPGKAVSNTAINNENNNDNNNTPNAMVTSVNSNNRKDSPSDVVTSASVNSGPNNPGGVAVSATSGSGLNAAKALSTGLSLANGNIGLNMGAGGISVSLKDGVRPENSLNINSQKNKDDANEVTTKSKILPNENSNTLAQIKKNSFDGASKNPMKDENQNSNNKEASGKPVGAGNANDLTNDFQENRIIKGRENRTLKDNRGTISSISNDNGNAIITSDNNASNTSAKTSKKGASAVSSFNDGANLQGITVNGNSNFLQVADYNNGSKAFATPDGKTKLFVGKNAIISTSDIPGGGSSTFSFVQGENGKGISSILGGEEHPPRINSTVPEKNDNFNNKQGNKHPSRFYNSLDNKIVVEIGNDSFIKSASFQEVEGLPASHKNVNPVLKSAFNQPNEKLFKSRNGKITVVIENDDHIKFLNFFETSNNDSHSNVKQNNENKEGNNHNNNLKGAGDITKTDKEKLQVPVSVNNNDRNAIGLSGSGEGAEALKNDKSPKAIDGTGVVNSNIGISSNGETANGNSVTSETNGGGNGPQKTVNVANVSAGPSAPDRGSGASISSVGVGLTPTNGGSGMAFSSGEGGIASPNGVSGSSVPSGGNGLSVSNGSGGISVAGGGTGIAVTNDNGNSKNGNAISINSGVGSGLVMNSGSGNGVSSVASSVGDGTKNSGVVSSAFTGASPNDVGSGISFSNIGENINLKVGDNSKQLKGKGGGPKLELTGRGVNLQL